MVDFEKDSLMREVDDEVRRERLQRFWKTFGTYVVGASVLILLLTVGAVGWQSYKKSRQAELTSQLLAAQRALTDNRTQEAEGLLKGVVKANDPSLSALAEIRLKELYLREDKTKDAEATAVSLMKYDGDTDAFGWFSEMLGADEKKLAELNNEANPFRATAREMLAIRYLEKKDFAAARTLLTSIRDDAETPPTMKERASLLLSTVAEDNSSTSVKN